MSGPTRPTPNTPSTRASDSPSVVPPTTSYPQPTPARAVPRAQRPVLRWAAPGFVRTTLTPAVAFSAVLAVGAVATTNWRVLACLPAAAGLATLIWWAIDVRVAARRGYPIHPTAQAAALVVLLVGITAAAAVCVLTVGAPELLGLATGGAR